jgi:hypothetical protein
VGIVPPRTLFPRGACRSHVKQGILPVFPPTIGKENRGRTLLRMEGNRSGVTCSERPPQIMDLNTTISELQKVITTVFGESIVVRTLLDPALGPVQGDARKVESVLVNLFMQAHDALPSENQLVVTTSNLELSTADADAMRLSPGRYAQLQLVVSRKLETGAIRDMVEQLRGAISVKSAPGERFAVTVILPQST